MSKHKCKACEEAGPGFECTRCATTRCLNLRKDTVEAVKGVFDAHYHAGGWPTMGDIIRAVEWAYEPKVLYAAGFRDKHGAMGMFMGPSPALRDIRKCQVVPDKKKRTAYIVKMTQTEYNGDPEIEVVARWHGGVWQRKRK